VEQELQVTEVAVVEPAVIVLLFLEEQKFH
jgi:hypothetical protein